MNFIDIHTHILHGVDDGASDLEQSLAMASAAYRDGVKSLVATPHVIKGVFENSREKILKNVANLNYCLKYSGIKMTILPGAEYYLEPDLPKRLAAGELLTMNDNGHYLLVELPATIIPEYTDQIFYDIQLQGVTPIIAHPERNAVLMQKPILLNEWANRGILAQVTTTSINGGFGREVKKKALLFLQTGSAQIVASDGHDARKRAPVFYDAFMEIEHFWGMDIACKLTYDNPERIVNGKRINQPKTEKTMQIWKQYLQRLRTALG
ncbi:MAG: phosphotransferase [Syntrophomonadaceae bacterium]|nr:phosphotransferase [Syntrophomonadaceae bacterium]